jgi:hypothetical protein
VEEVGGMVAYVFRRRCRRLGGWRVLLGRHKVS